MTLRQAAQNVLSEARDGIAWIALWKEGRGWNATEVWPDYTEETDSFQMDAVDLDLLQSIADLDPQAILVNSYYHNLGDTETMTRDSLADTLRWQYDLGHARIFDKINRKEDIQ